MKNWSFLWGGMLVGALGLNACQQPAVDESSANPSATTGRSRAAAAPTIRTETVVTGYEIIWGMDFLPNGTLIFSEKRGRLFSYANGKATQLSGLPGDIDAGGQGGLLDVKVHPQYFMNGWIYASYASKPAGSSGTQLNLIRFKLLGNRLYSLSTVFKTSATNTWRGHYGGRIEFDRSGFLYLSVGEGGPGSQGGESSFNKNAQDVKTEWGKVHRMTDAGRVPSDNPVLPGNSGPTTIFSYGHRNPQGLVLNPSTGVLWETEHGPKGGDEVNIVQKGLNYGWPLVSNGVNYDGSIISASPTRAGIQAPVYTWTPSIGTCGLAFITSDKFKDWKGRLATGALAKTYLSLLEVSNNQVASETKLLEGQGRVRNVKQGPDGNLYVSLEGPGRILRLIPQ